MVAQRLIRMAAAAVLVTAGLPLAALNARAASGDSIGDARTIVSVVKADFEKQERSLSVGDNVRQDEVIEVSSDGKGEFRLNDDTKLALGPGSRMVLDKFVYDSDKKAGTIVLDLTQGAFRFITGVASKPTYLIRTPVAAITVRGTIFDLFILPDTTVWLLLHQGAIEVTSAKGVCHVLDQPGQLMRVTSDGSVGLPINWKSLPGHEAVPFDTAFPFVANAPQIDPVPVMERAVIVDGAFPDVPVKACTNPGAPKIQKAEDDSSKPQKRMASNDDDGGPSTPAGAQITLKAEPAPGALMAGMKVFVDNGSCPAGQIKEITAANPKAGVMNRTSRCVAAEVAAKSDPLKEYRLGGKFAAFDPVVSQYNQTGELFRISGYCKSACTLFLGIRNVCVEPGAVLIFHAGNSATGAISADATKHMLSAYNSRLRAYLLEHHVMDTATLFQISGTDLIQKFGYRECPLSANK
jgi:hypothetical protein